MAIKAMPARAVVPEDGFTEGISKLLPVAVAVAYVAAVQLLDGVALGASKAIAAWVMFAVGIVATPLEILATWDPDAAIAATALKGAIPHLIISTVAFAIWAFGLGEPFSQFVWYEPWMGGLALILGTLMLGTVGKLIARFRD